ncbi:dicarboxylate/amino acid:cation symporter [Planococcus salinus]|uniref:Dicarboxylate/amino acid:cation symporter n=1 Tax=Planococcus salinus TaxID=1848460 RepID=A0A3M8P717_9BACL|nr:dicarboxylate/amino acid:cation symporter [Planococcus salinus]RNF39467.1 dicarboxylate/amino acid:cation symporter [Planococcus salinus]
MKLGLIPKLLIGLGAGILIGFFGPEWMIRLTETGNVLLGNLIKFFIPLIIFAFVAASITEFSSKAGRLLSFTIGISYIDTILACMFGAAVAYLVVPGFALEASQAVEAATIGAPFVELDIPPIMGIISALVLAIVVGMASSWGEAKILSGAVIEFRNMIERVIKSFIVPAIPFFIACIFAGLTAKGELFGTMSVFGKMLVLILLLQAVWLITEYTIAGIVSKQNPFTMFKAMLPAYFTAMGTMSSAVTMTVSLKQARTVPYINKKIADFVMPLCANVHLSGAAMTLTISAITVSLLTQGGLPPVGLIISFIIILGVIEVGAVGVPGGSALAAIGILQSTLGFNEAAIGLMLALFMIQDSFGTATNIAGDGAIAMIVNRFFGKEDEELEQETAPENEVALNIEDARL